MCVYSCECISHYKISGKISGKKFCIKNDDYRYKRKDETKISCYGTSLISAPRVSKKVPLGQKIVKLVLKQL